MGGSKGQYGSMGVGECGGKCSGMYVPRCLGVQAGTYVDT
jgi:hypothetical protein